MKWDMGPGLAEKNVFVLCEAKLIYLSAREMTCTRRGKDILIANDLWIHTRHFDA